VPVSKGIVMTDLPPLEPSDAFARLGSIKLTETDLDSVFAQIAELAKRTVPGAAEVSVSLVGGKAAHTAAFTGGLALALDESQYALGHGPCLEAAATDTTRLVPDMAAESRWPDWTRRALAAGAHSSLSIGLPVRESVAGALNIYATRPRAFDDDAVSIAQALAGYAAVAMANAYLYDATTTLAEHMEAVMRSRAVIEQAKGIIMAQRRCTAEEAFAVLTRMSQDSDRTLRDVATAIVSQAGRPGR
jgi:GAF domain-containing protein